MEVIQQVNVELELSLTLNKENVCLVLMDVYHVTIATAADNVAQISTSIQFLNSVSKNAVTERDMSRNVMMETTTMETDAAETVKLKLTSYAEADLQIALTSVFHSALTELHSSWLDKSDTQQRSSSTLKSTSCQLSFSNPETATIDALKF